MQIEIINNSNYLNSWHTSKNEIHFLHNVNDKMIAIFCRLLTIFSHDAGFTRSSISMKKIIKINGSASSFIGSHKINFEEKKT